MTALKVAMKAKDQTALTALRAVKSAILLAQTESGAKEELTEEQELKILQKLDIFLTVSPLSVVCQTFVYTHPLEEEC